MNSALIKSKFQNKKILLGGLTMALIVAIIIVSSFIPFILDPSKIWTTKFLTDELIIIVITIFTTITMMFIAQASNSDNPKSELCKARVSFEESVKKIVNLTRFYQWIKKVLREQDKQEIIERELSYIGLTYDYYTLDNTELRELIDKPQKYGDKFYKSITDEQYREVQRIRKKICKLKFVAPTYYITTKNIEPRKTSSERASSESIKKLSYVLINLITKIIITLIFAVIIGSLVRDMTTEYSQSQAWLDFLSRIFAFSSSSFLGYVIGSKLNDLDAFYINDRIDIHNRYLNDKTFIEVDEGKEEYIERVKDEQVLIEYKQDSTIQEIENNNNNIDNINK